MPTKLASAVLNTFGRIGATIEQASPNQAPVIGRMHRWMVAQASVSEDARRLLKKIVYFSMAMITIVVLAAIYFISAGKATAVTSTLLGAIFTLFSGIMTIALSAFATALNSGPATPPSPGT